MTERRSPCYCGRQATGTVANGFGLLGLAGLLAETWAGVPTRGDEDGGRATAGRSIDRPPHHAPRARRAIFIFLNGGPSHVDLLDPKARLSADHGKPLPFEKPKLARTTTENLMASPYRFARHGRSGIEVSELLLELATTVDVLCVIRSMVADNINHPNACLQMFTGEQILSRPSLCSWLLYGLGSESPELPGFVAICPGGADASLLGIELPARRLPGDPRRRPGPPDRQSRQRRDPRRRAAPASRPGRPAQRAASPRPRGGQPPGRADRLV